MKILVEVFSKRDSLLTKTQKFIFFKSIQSELIKQKGFLSERVNFLQKWIERNEQRDIVLNKLNTIKKMFSNRREKLFYVGLLSKENTKEDLSRKIVYYLSLMDFPRVILDHTLNDKNELVRKIIINSEMFDK
jgi:hypothetical protein